MQPSANYLSVPRRELDVEDYIDIIRRHWAWIAGPTFVALVASVVVAFLWPDTYVSYAVMRISPAQVPERIVQVLRRRAGDVARRRAHRSRGGARPLGAPGPRPARAGGVREHRRGDRDDSRNRRMGSEPGVPPSREVARGRFAS